MEHSVFAKGHNLNPGKYNHFEVDGAKSKLQNCELQELGW